MGATWTTKNVADLEYGDCCEANSTVLGIRVNYKKRRQGKSWGAVGEIHKVLVPVSVTVCWDRTDNPGLETYITDYPITRTFEVIARESMKEHEPS